MTFKKGDLVQVRIGMFVLIHIYDPVNFDYFPSTHEVRIRGDGVIYYASSDQLELITSIFREPDSGV